MTSTATPVLASYLVCGPRIDSVQRRSFPLIRSTRPVNRTAFTNVTNNVFHSLPYVLAFLSGQTNRPLEGRQTLVEEQRKSVR